jgi:hypothetical protein
VISEDIGKQRATFEVFWGELSAHWIVLIMPERTSQKMWFKDSGLRTLAPV